MGQNLQPFTCNGGIMGEKFSSGTVNPKQTNNTRLGHFSQRATTKQHSVTGSYR